MNPVSLRAKAKITNSLICFLTGLRGQLTTVELRNENSVVGRIDSVDERMNMTMTEATFTTLSGVSCKFELFYIQGSNIRYVHIPKEIDIIKTTKQQLAGYQRRPYMKCRSDQPKVKRNPNSIAAIEDKRRQMQKKHRKREHLTKIANAIKEKLLKMQID